MPELPEVETIASDLDEVAAGRIIEKAAVSFAGIVAGEAEELTALVEGCRVEAVKRLGKWLYFSLQRESEAAALLVHLKMTGQFHLGPWPEEEGGWLRHDHAAFKLSGLPAGADTLLYRDIRKFGRLRAFGAQQLADFVAGLGLGPDPFGLEAEDFHQRLSRRKGKLKTLLLDQSLVSGLGNIYADESLFAAGLCPWSSPAELTAEDSARLLAQMRLILRAAIEARGSTVSNYQGLKGTGSYQKSHKVYGRDGSACPRCGALIERMLLGGRSTHYCPVCQAGAKK